MKVEMMMGIRKGVRFIEVDNWRLEIFRITGKDFSAIYYEDGILKEKFCLTGTGTLFNMNGEREGYNPIEAKLYPFIQIFFEFEEQGRK